MHIDSANRVGNIQVMETIGERIRRLRKEQGLNQTQLAGAVGVNQSTISDIENDLIKFEAGILMALSRALLKSPQFIMTGKPEPVELSDFEVKMVSAFRHAGTLPAPRSSAPTPAPTGPAVRQVSPPAAKVRKQRRVG